MCGSEYQYYINGQHDPIFFNVTPVSYIIVHHEPLGHKESELTSSLLINASKLTNQILHGAHLKLRE